MVLCGRAAGDCPGEPHHSALSCTTGCSKLAPEKPPVSHLWTPHLLHLLHSADIELHFTAGLCVLNRNVTLVSWLPAHVMLMTSANFLEAAPIPMPAAAGQLLEGACSHMLLVRQLDAAAANAHQAGSHSCCVSFPSKQHASAPHESETNKAPAMLVPQMTPIPYSLAQRACATSRGSQAC